jgi:hypothetical protein
MTREKDVMTIHVTEGNASMTLEKAAPKSAAWILLPAWLSFQRKNCPQKHYFAFCSSSSSIVSTSVATIRAISSAATFWVYAAKRALYIHSSGSDKKHECLRSPLRLCTEK